MKVDSADRQQGVPEKGVAQPKTGNGHFSMLLNERLLDPDAAVNPLPEIVRKKDDSAVQSPDRIHLGVITEEMPTVSNLLIRHPNYRKDTWRIVHSEGNKDKPFTRIQPGTDIYLNPETLEISWDRDEFRIPAAQEKASMVPPAPSPSDAPANLQPTAEYIELGTISRDNPTVSHLLKKHPAYGQAAYPIIHAAINQDKPYTRMLEGTRVYMNPETFEIIWNSGKSDQEIDFIAQNRLPSGPEAPQAVAGAPDAFSENLVKSVAHFVGSSYDEMDCFELLVRGLNKMGVDYSRRGGLYDQLVKLAVSRGLPENAYLNGEGLIEASGTQVYVKSMPEIQDPAFQARQIYEEMKPLLNKGFILSFSTQTRGHTGIVSQKNRLWTYINSGNMDHHLGSRRDPKGVGEEILAEEIKNWVSIAAESRQPLKITLGRLDAQKLLNIET